MKDEGERGEMFLINSSSLGLGCSKQMGLQRRNFESNFVKQEPKFLSV